MGKKIYYIIFILLICFSCEEVYKADLDQVENMVVIESLITNDLNKNFVKVSKTRGFYETDAQEMVAGATVELVDEDGLVYYGEESGIGKFTINHSAVPGRKYKLVVVAEDETYESELEVMPPLPTVDSLYALGESVTEYAYSSYGEPIPHQIEGMHAYADLPVTDDLNHYRFYLTKTLEYIVPPPVMMPTPPAVYGWLNYGSTGNFNIKGPSRFGNEALLKKHSLLFLTNTIDGFVSAEAMELGVYMVGWVVSMEQFGLSEGTYNFYESMNDQLDASGKLFDAVFAQLEPNLKCVSNPGKKVLGYFDLSSYRFSRFFMMRTHGAREVHLHLMDNEPSFPASGEIEDYNPPYFWEDRYNY